MTTNELIALIGTSILIIASIGFFIYGFLYDKREIEEMEKFIEGIKAGDKYIYWIPSYSNNPFDEDYIVEVEVIEVRKNSSGEIWIKYLTPDGERIESGTDFYKYIKHGKQ